MTLVRLVGLAALLLVAAGCALFPGPSPDTRTERERRLADQAAIWADAGIDSYTFTISRGCFCPPEAIGPFVVTVEDGEVTAVSRGGVAVGANDTHGVPLTIDGVFDLLGAVADEAELTVTWHAGLAYPIEASVDPLPHAIDDEYTLVITELTPAD